MCDSNPFGGRPLSFVALIGIWLWLPFSLACVGRTMLRGNGINEYEKQMILDLHNRMRQAVALGQIDGQPPAANMIEMKWDDELADKAQKWALTCSSPHVHDSYRHTSRFLVGQNTAATWTTRVPTNSYDVEANFPGAIQKWFDEVIKFRFGKQSHPGAGHYAQMIWANTYLIGCGYSFFYSPGTGYTKSYVCNYGPSGNVKGESPYRKGYPNCYDFGLENSRKYLGLCGMAIYVSARVTNGFLVNSSAFCCASKGNPNQIKERLVFQTTFSDYKHKKLVLPVKTSAS